MRSCKFLLVVAALACSQVYAEDMYVAARLHGARQSISGQQPYSPRAVSIIDGPAASNKAAGSFALGRYLPSDWRVEAEYTAPTSSEFTTTWRFARGPFSGTSRNVIQTTSQRLMLNVYKDFPLNQTVSLYAGAGVGLAHVEEEGYQGNASRRFEKNSQNNFAYSLTLGTDFHLSDSWILGAGYRYVDMGTIRSGRNSFVNPLNPPRDEQHQGKLREQSLFVEARMNF